MSNPSPGFLPWGEVLLHQLQHQDKAAVRAFYAQFTRQVIVGLEASGYSPWFERLLEELGCEVWLGHATEIRRRARSRLEVAQSLAVRWPDLVVATAGQVDSA